MRTLSVQHVRDNLSDVLGSVYYGKEPVMVAKKGKPVAVVISPDQYEQLERQRADALERFWRAAEQIGERNKDKDPDEELAFITGVVEEVRQEAYEAEQRAKAAGGR